MKIGRRAIKSNAASSKKRTLSSVKHMWFTMMSAWVSSSSLLTRVTPRSANAASSACGSQAITRFTRPIAFSAVHLPILPNPTMPST